MDVIQQAVKRGLKEEKWVIIAGHGIEGQGWEPVSIELIEQICQHLASLQPSVWVGTLAQVATYEYLKQELETEFAINGKELTVKLRGFDPERYQALETIPVTVEIKLADGYSVAEVKTDCATLIESKNNTYFVTVDLKKHQAFSVILENGF